MAQGAAEQADQESEISEPARYSKYQAGSDQSVNKGYIMAKESLTLDYLRERLSYDASTGALTYKAPRGKRKAGDRADRKSFHPAGYWRVFLLGEWFWAHRAVWFYLHGEWPQYDIDHINGDKSDNRECNLRSVTHSENQQNRVAPSRSNKTGVLGVQQNGNRYSASISINGTCKRLGFFDTKEEAHEAYLIAKRQHHSCCTI